MKNKEKNIKMTVGYIFPNAIKTKIVTCIRCFEKEEAV